MAETMIRPIGTMDVHELALKWHLGESPRGLNLAHTRATQEGWTFAGYDWDTGEYLYAPPEKKKGNK